MVKKYKIILSVLLIIMIGVAVVVFTGIIDINSIIGTPTKPHSENTDKLGSDYEQSYVTDTAVSLPMMKTDIENIFYTMDKLGNVGFYSLTEGTITEIPETGSFEVSAKCSSQNLPAEIHYIEKDGKTIGYGLFTNINHPDVMLYDYAFFKVTNMFSGFADDEGTLLMLLDVDSSRFYLENKIYSEIFYLYSDHTSEKFLSEDQRTIDINALEKTDYKMFTNGILNQGDNDNVLFFSSRYYNSYSESGKVDIFTSGGSGTNVDNIRHATDVGSLNFWRTENGTLYFMNNGDGTFSLCELANDDISVKQTFAGDIKADYIISGDYILNKSTGSIYGVLDGSEKKLDYSLFKKTFTPDMFTISQNGSYCVYRGANKENSPVCVAVNLTNGTITAYDNTVFGYIADMQALNDGTILISAATGDSASAYYQLITNIA